MKKNFVRFGAVILTSLFSSIAFGGELVTLGANSWKPYVEFHEEKATGIAVFKVSQILAEIDQELKVSSLPFKRILRYAEDGRIDGVLVSADRKERRAYLAFTGPIFCERRVFLVKEGKEFDWQDKAQLKGKKLGLGAGFYVGKRIENWVAEGTIPPITTANELNLFNLLRNERLDFIVYSEKEFKEFQKLGMQRVKEVIAMKEPLNELTLHIGFSKKNNGVKRRDLADIAIQKLGLQESCNG